MVADIFADINSRVNLETQKLLKSKEKTFNELVTGLEHQRFDHNTPLESCIISELQHRIQKKALAKKVSD